MKGDFSRSTFSAEKHYSGVRQQQGRVNVDADWNEQLDIAGHRTETETVDVIGYCGGPLAAAGFHIVAATADLDADEQARPENQDAPPLDGPGDFYISGGRYYVGGLLCENEQIVNYAGQPDYPAAEPIADSGVYVAYLDVWQRHVTALEDEEIREVALGGPDTCTRQKTLWQLKTVRVGDLGDPVTCLSALAIYDDAITAPDGQLAAQAEPGGAATGPCVIPESAGYRRLENQLYRVEVHEGGSRGTATFKWSRDNGAVVARWEASSGDELTVSESGRDKVLAFAAGMWVELTDDEHELNGEHGTLVRLLSVDDRVLELDVGTADGPTDLASFGTNPKVRRWDSDGVLTPASDDWLDLEGGVQVQITAGDYRTGDYWTIPARTNTGDVEWPVDAITDDPLALSPHGIEHAYCRVAVMHFDGAAWTEISDCRSLFPPLTELTNLEYVSGDGQEALPDSVIDKPLQVGVANGQHPVAGARVRFERLDGDGVLLPGASTEESGSDTERIVFSDADGIAECLLRLGAPTGERTHCVEATLLDVANDTVHLPVRFNASLSLASHVYYDGDACSTLAAADTVQDALDTLAAQAILVMRAGDGQDTGPGQQVPRPIQVAVVNACGPIAGARVEFTPEGDGRVAETAAGLPGAVAGPITVATDADGLATVAWQLDPDPARVCQFLTAGLLDAGGRPIHQPAMVAFTANVAQSAGCYDFLDDLRADGVVRDEYGVLGLAVTQIPDENEGVAYAGGVAYVGGCRYVIRPGGIGLDPGLLRNTIIVDDRGQLVLLDTASPPRAFATLADVAVFGGRIVRIVDRRLDLTHLDLRVNDVAASAAARRADRRAAMPALALSLPELRYRDGRNYSISFQSENDLAYGLGFDGASMWVCNLYGEIYIIDTQRFPNEPPERMSLDAGTAECVYDGSSHMWFSAPIAPDGSAEHNEVISVDVRTRAVTRYRVGDVPVRMVSDGGRVWVGNYDSDTLSVIDIDRGEVVMTIPLIDPNGQSYSPRSMTYDGEYVWVGTEAAALFRVDPLGRAELVSLGRDMPDGIDWLGFDGAKVWMLPDDGDVIHVDVMSGYNEAVDGTEGDTAVIDGTHVWVAEDDDFGVTLRAIRCATGRDEGVARIQGDDPSIVALAFDGTHVWYTLLAESAGSVIGRQLLV